MNRKVMVTRLHVATQSNGKKPKMTKLRNDDSLRKTQTWTLMNPPSDHQVIDNR